MHPYDFVGVYSATTAPLESVTLIVPLLELALTVITA